MHANLSEKGHVGVCMWILLQMWMHAEACIQGGVQEYLHTCIYMPEGQRTYRDVYMLGLWLKVIPPLCFAIKRRRLPSSSVIQALYAFCQGQHPKANIFDYDGEVYHAIEQRS